jgi:hypothetical protein
MVLQQSLFSDEEIGGISLEDVFEAYFECRKKKRNTCNALAFESEYERKCVELWREINSGTYHPSRSIAFIINKPVKREVFAADFRDRVVHHLIAQRIVPLLEEQFINDSYSTRKGKGTLYGILKIEEHIRQCSENYTKDCHILKIDIRSFFMKISKQRLYDITAEFLKARYTESDLPMLLYLLRKTVFNRPERNCIRRSAPKEWRGLPKDKSLFHTDGSCGLPIGNLTSQLLALNFLDELDHLITGNWGVEHYGRYVDDMVLVHPSQEHLLEVRERISRWLSTRGLMLHPRKMYLQHYTKGVLFIGGMILPGRKYLSNRTVGFCYDAIERLNRLAASSPDYVLTHGEEFVSTVNSYLGMMRHFSSYKLRRKVMEHVGKEWWKIIYFEGHIEKAVLKKQYKPLVQKRNEIRNDIDELKIAMAI